MGRIKTAEAIKVEQAVDALSGTMTLDQVREALEGVQLGSNDGFLRRTLKERVLTGKAQMVSAGVYKFFKGSGSIAPIAPIDNGTFVPEIDDTFVLPLALDKYLPYLKDTPGHHKFTAVGPKGCGKTECGIQVAAHLKRPVFIVDCSIIREPRDFFGSKELANGRTMWVDNAFTRIVEEGNCVIVLDELNRASDMVGNALLPLLDSRQRTYIQERGASVVAGPNIVWWATMNKGAQYTGTNALDAALADRFNRVFEVTYLPKDKEIDLLVKRTGISANIASCLVDVADRTRQANTEFSTQLSTRQLLAAAADYQAIGTDSLVTTLVNMFDPNGGVSSERQAFSNLLVGKFM